MFPEKVKLIVIVSICIVTAAVGAVIIRKSGEMIPTAPTVSSSPSVEASTSTSPSPNLSSLPVAQSTPKPSPKTSSSPASQPSPTLNPVAVDTTAPVITSMTGPSNGSTVSYTDFCFPIMLTDNVSKYPQLYVRTQFDTNTWSNWSNNANPCYNNVSNGTHRFSVQAKDEAGNISGTITREFAVSPIMITLSGQIYKDSNCNATKDSGENSVGGVTVNIFQEPQFTLLSTVISDSNGNYSYSRNINDSENYILKPSPVSPSGYKSNPNFNQDTTLNSSVRSATIDVPQVPNENIGLCQV